MRDIQEEIVILAALKFEESLMTERAAWLNQIANEPTPEKTEPAE